MINQCNYDWGIVPYATHPMQSKLTNMSKCNRDSHVYGFSGRTEACHLR